ncbi:peptide ABC transporter ATP-binding protein [Pseudonocardia sp. MH-G8]|nr:peptide ABC transporter ATP-binding protein [Pseudonocardia sp. MH-G8]
MFVHGRLGALVEGVSFRIRAGQVLALVGESGSGKTTTALALMGEGRGGTAISGSVTVAGETVAPGRAPRPGAVGYVPQHPASVLNPVRRIGSVLRETALRHLDRRHLDRRHLDRRRSGPPAPPGWRARRRAADVAVLDALRRAQVAEPEQFLGRYPHQLSGGQQQRVVLAQALLCDPVLIVADEPTTGQDALTRERVVAELAAIAAEGVAVLLLTHDLAMVRRLADEVVVLRNGVTVETGAAAAVLAHPEHAYTRALVAAQLDPTRSSGPAEPPGPAPVVEAHRITATHRHRGVTGTVLHGVSVSIGRGRRVALVGRSGSGKTTLARCLAGLRRPTGGEVRWNGVPLAPGITRRTASQIAAVQYVFQDAAASFDEHRSVLAQVARTATLLRGAPDDASARRALTRVGLSAATIERAPAGLSGGELQRAALARALLAEPELLVCDEVTSGLDTRTQEVILDLLAGLQAETGCALLLITHDLGVVARLAEDVVVLDSGRVVEEGTVADVLAGPHHPFTRSLVDAALRQGEQR